MIISILKIIGTILLILLAFILFIIGYVLLAAIRFKAYGEYDEKKKFMVCAHDILRVAYVSYTVTPEGSTKEIILFWGLINIGNDDEREEFFDDIDEAEAEAEAFLNEPDEDFVGADEETPAVEDDEADEDFGEAKANETKALEVEETEASETTVSPEEQVSEESALDEKAAVSEEFEETSADEPEDLFDDDVQGDGYTFEEDKKPFSFEALDERFGISDKKKKLAALSRETSDEQNKAAVAFLCTESIKLLGKLLPEINSADIVYSIGFPDLTGMVTGMLAVCPALYGDDIFILPDFESDDIYAKGNANISGSTSLIVFLIFFVRIIANKDCRRLYKRIRHHKN